MRGPTIPTLWSECQAIWSLLVPSGTVRSVSFRETGLWRDLREGPAALAATVDAVDGVSEAARLLRSDRVRRIVAVGNGAAYYVAHALWLAALESDGHGPPITPVPRGGARAPAVPLR